MKVNQFIKPNSEVPIYKQLAEMIENAIYTGEFKSGDKLPSEKELCDKYDVSRTSVRQALNILSQQDLIYSVHGKGTFVRVPEVRQQLTSIKRFGAALEETGLDGHTEVLSFDEGVENRRAYKELCARYFNLFLLGYIHDAPVVYYKSYILEELKDTVSKAVKKLQNGKAAFTTLDVYDELDIRITTIKQNISAVIANDDKIKLMNLNSPIALLRLETVLYDEKNRPVEYRTAYYRSDVYTFNLDRTVE